MPRYLTRMLIALTLTGTVMSGTSPDWTRYVAADGSYSFHYPTGWQVQARDSAVEITNPAVDEELLITSLPFAEEKNPRQTAEAAIGLFRPANPDLRVTRWEPSRPGREGACVFSMTYTSKNRPYRGDVLVLKNRRQAMWVSYSAPADGYDRGRAIAILQGLVGSIAAGDTSLPPTTRIANTPPPVGKTTAVDESRMRNAQAFLFVVEFALGAPLTGSQEAVIRDELLRGWSARSSDELKKYDAYPGIVRVILQSKAADLDSLRRQLEASVREWLQVSDATDPAVKIIATCLAQRGRSLVDGDPPLTEMAATAYAEITLFSRRLHTEPQARLVQPSPTEVDRIRRQLATAWPGFNDEQRRQVLATPGLWVSLRQVLRFGSAEEQDRVRSALLSLTDPPAAPASGGASAGRKPLSMVKHTAMLAIQRTTFNHYRWCHGFSSYPSIW